MIAAVVLEPSIVEIATIADPTPGPGEVVVQVAACGICGTDLHISQGEFAPHYPIVPGHEFSGEIVAVGESVSVVSLGDRVAVDPSLPCHACGPCRAGKENLCLRWAAIGVTEPGGAAEFVRVPASNCVLLPENVELTDYALIEPIACAISGFDVLPRRPGVHWLIYGAGTMGLLMGRLARTGAASLTVVETREERRTSARSLLDGATVVADAAAADRELWDVVVDCSGATGAIEDGLGRVARGGTYLQFGVPHASAKVEISPYRIYNQEITITGSMSVRHSFGRAVELMAAGFAPADQLITSRLPLTDYAIGLAQLAAGTGLKTVVIP